jgi:hypothetical protein
VSPRDGPPIQEKIMLPLVAYYLVSTQGQGRLGLGLGAQRKAVAAFAEANSFAIVGEFTETEIGRPAPRTSRAALWQAKRAADRLRKASRS